jgi:hypothetical protein
MPSDRKSTNTGIMVTCAGSIMVESMIMNKMPRPRNLKRAKPNPTSEQEITCPTMQSSVTKTVFERAGNEDGMLTAPINGRLSEVYVSPSFSTARG